MNTVQKLQFIKKISGLSQEKLAAYLGVSFPTLNSWMNGKSNPRKKMQERINELYASYTGEKTIPEDVLSAKKAALHNMQQAHKDIVAKISNARDIYDELSLLLTYNTNSIEGSTLTEFETAQVLFHNTALPNKTLIEQLEAKNHQAAWDFLMRYLNQKTYLIDEQLILKLHSILMNGIRDDAGMYRTCGVRIVGANIPTANYVKVPALMEELAKSINSKQEDVFEHVASTHSRFEKIHPFSDGNGRIGRLIIHAMLMRENYPPALIKAKDKQFYYSYLNKSQKTGDTSLLEDFICDAVLDGFKLIED